MATGHRGEQVIKKTLIGVSTLTLVVSLIIISVSPVGQNPQEEPNNVDICLLSSLGVFFGLLTLRGIMINDSNQFSLGLFFGYLALSYYVFQYIPTIHSYLRKQSPVSLDTFLDRFTNGTWQRHKGFIDGIQEGIRINSDKIKGDLLARNQEPNTKTTTESPDPEATTELPPHKTDTKLPSSDSTNESTNLPDVTTATIHDVTIRDVNTTDPTPAVNSTDIPDTPPTSTAKLVFYITSDVLRLSIYLILLSLYTVYLKWIMDWEWTVEHKKNECQSNQSNKQDKAVQTRRTKLTLTPIVE